jgi:hypothetical protein
MANPWYPISRQIERQRIPRRREVTVAMATRSMSQPGIHRRRLLLDADFPSPQGTTTDDPDITRCGGGLR